MTTSGLDSFPEGWPDAAALERLANELFSALPASVAGFGGTLAGLDAPVPSVTPPGLARLAPSTAPKGSVSLVDSLPADIPLGSSASGLGFADPAPAIPGYEHPAGGPALGPVDRSLPVDTPLSRTALDLAFPRPAGVPKLQYLSGIPSSAQPPVGTTPVSPSSGPGLSAGNPPVDSPLTQTAFGAGFAGPAPVGQFDYDGVPEPGLYGASVQEFYFLEHVPAAGGVRVPGYEPADAPAEIEQPASPLDVNVLRRDFPILSERVNGRQLVWLDNAATTQKPQVVIDRVKHFYEHENSNVHRAAHELAARATDAYEGAREKVRGFLGAASVNEIVFVRGATEAINLVAKSWGHENVGKDDEIVISWLEHHANIVPWQQLAKEKGAHLRIIPVDDTGQIIIEEYAMLLNPRTKIVSIAHVSNALGTITPVELMTRMARLVGAKVLVDGAQAVSHMPVNVQQVDPDWYVFSGHKVFGPTGIGVVYGKEALLNDTPPWQGGGNMIADVTFEHTVYQNAPARFEAGTGNIADAVGLGAAIDYVTRVGMPSIAQYEHQLLEYATRLLEGIPGLRLIGTAPSKASVLSFVLQGHKTEDVGASLSREGIAVRAGHHCAQPILRRFGVEKTVRASLAFYNTCADVDAMIAVLTRLASGRDAMRR